MSSLEYTSMYEGNTVPEPVKEVNIVDDEDQEEQANLAAINQVIESLAEEYEMLQRYKLLEAS
jgi:hypothetical protein